jgi:galacturonokinase
MAEVAAQLLNLEPHRDLFRRSFGSARDLCLVRAPYRVCPLGAHSDHQGGTVLGMAIARGVSFLWRPRADRLVRIHSLEFPEEFSFSVSDLPRPRGKGFWGDYVVGAVWALAEQGCALTRGLDGAIGGEFPVGGLSSSAAVGLAYGVAFRQANEHACEPWDVVRSAVHGENGYVGVSCGLLDPATIFFAEEGKLVCIDCRDETVAVVAPGQSMPPYAVGIVFSGIARALARSGYNNRVTECRQAAQRLGELTGRGNGVRRLGEIRREEFEHYKHELSAPLRGRAEHYFTEYARVHAGLEAWQRGDLARFGALITQSGASSVCNYEAGCPEIILLWEVLAQTPGVYGTRFSGGGFGGSVIALIDPAEAPAIEARIRQHYLDRYPSFAPEFRVDVQSSARGLWWGKLT